MKRPTRVTRRIVLGHDLGGGRVGLMVVQRAELEDVDALIVEAEALLAEQHRARAVELDRERDQRHHRQRQQQADAADHAVEQPFHHQVPVGDRRLEHVERRHLAEIGIGAGTEAQLVGVRGQADVDRQHPQLLQHFQDARLRRDRQREQHEVDAGAAGEFDDVVDLAEFRAAGAGIERAGVVAVVEHAEHVDVGIVLRLERLDQLLAVLVGADDDGAAVEPALRAPSRAPARAGTAARRPARRGRRRRTPTSQSRETSPPSLAKNDAPMNSRNTNAQDEIIRVICRSWPRNTCDFVDVGGLEADHGGDGHAEDRRDVFPVEAAARHDIAEIERRADQR